MLGEALCASGPHFQSCQGTTNLKNAACSYTLWHFNRNSLIQQLWKIAGMGHVAFDSILPLETILPSNVCVSLKAFATVHMVMIWRSESCNFLQMQW